MENSNQERIIFDGLEYESVLINHIQQANHDIFISCYILENGEFGKKIIHLLQEKAQSGVQICMVLDGFGSWDWIDSVLPHIDQKNFKIRIFHPIKFKSLNWNFRKIRKFNQRNHQKLFLFDQKIAILGSRNINDDAIRWRETSVEIVGKSVQTLVSVFQMIWKRSHSRIFKRYFPLNESKLTSNMLGSKHVYSNYTFALRNKTREFIFQKLKGAQKKICITTPYFYPTQRAMKVLLEKAKAGVSVSVLLPKESDVVVSKWISQCHYHSLLKAGVRIFEYTPQILHAKSMVIDDWAMIGSSNFNRRSILRDIELDYSADQVETVQSLVDQFRKDTENSKKIDQVPQIGIFQRIFVEVVEKFFSSWF